MEIKKIYNNERGISLMEVLAVLVISAIVATLAISFLVSSNKQNHAQQDEVRQIYDAAYILKLLTKDIRQADDIEITGPPTQVFTTVTLKQNGTITKTYVYDGNGQLKRDSETLSRSMESFTITKSQNVVHITFSLKGEISSTTIALRTGGAL